MRFIADGPAIPAALLDQRDAGNVVFFCGAGISMNAGLPSFAGLTELVLEKLRWQAGLKALEAGAGYDRLFTDMIREFGHSEVQARVVSALRPARGAALDAHKDLLDLARSPTGLQLVTTNFDHLFERVDRKLPKYIAPALPNLGAGESLNGLVYLHGRSPGRSDRANKLVLSSAEFGRAYLAEGWANRFIQELRACYTIVLIGYSADDPPMRYLLEGLHHSQARRGSPIYAFVEGEQASLQESWDDRGVTVIPYKRGDDRHSGLWLSISAWAETVRDPERALARTLDLAKQSPACLAPHERGQVAQLVSTARGARSFAQLEPAAPADWLYVFDSWSRYAKVIDWGARSGREPFDPLQAYGLDDDAPREQVPNKPERPQQAWDLLSWQVNEETKSETIMAAGLGARAAPPLPERIRHLGRWLAMICDKPAACWWAAGKGVLHPDFSWATERRLATKDLHKDARRFWQHFLFEKRSDPHDHRWFEIQDLVKIHGWSGFTLRQFERALSPSIEISRMSGAFPAGDDSFGTTSLDALVRIEVKPLDTHSYEIAVPPEALAEVLGILTRSLKSLARYITDTGHHWSCPSLAKPVHPDSFPNELATFLLWYVDLFRRLIEVNPNAAKLTLLSWNPRDRVFEGKLAIWAVSLTDLLDGDEAFGLLAKLPAAILMDQAHRSELLSSLQARWPSWTVSQRRRLERRILGGDLRINGLDLKQRRFYRAADALVILRWLELNGTELTNTTKSFLPTLRALMPDWSDRWAENADEDDSARVSSLETDTDLQGLDVVPLKNLVSAAESQTRQGFSEFKDYRPFLGLVEKVPLRAVAGLRLAVKDEIYALQLWGKLLQHWPSTAPTRLTNLLALSLSRLPSGVLIELRHAAAYWVREHYEQLASTDRATDKILIEALLIAWASSQEVAGESTVLSTNIGGVEQARSKVSLTKAINAPLGNITRALLSRLQKVGRDDFKARDVLDQLPRLLAFKGRGAAHAAAVMTSYLPWLEAEYPEWTQRTLLPLLDPTNPMSEGAWHGWAARLRFLSWPSMKKLAPHFLTVVRGQTLWLMDDGDFRKVLQGFALLCVPGPGTKKALISASQANGVLSSISDEQRAKVLRALTYTKKEEARWEGFLKPFLEGAWPRQLRYRGEATSRAFANLIEANSSHYEDVAALVLPWLVPVPHLNLFAHRVFRPRNDNQPDLVKEHPDTTLRLFDRLVGTEKRNAPHQLRSILDGIAEAKPALRRTPAWERLADLTY